MPQQTIAQLLQEATNILSNRLEAELLLAQVLQVPRVYLHAWPDKLVAEELSHRLHSLVLRRREGEPMAYLLGTKEFWSLALLVNQDTLIPRPETELLVSAVLEQVGSSRAIKLLDLGTGSGAIAIALAKEHPEWDITATDYSEQALNVAKLNAKKHQVTNIQFIQSDWYEALVANDYHVIVSNPPYLSETEWPHYEAGLKYEPREALLAAEEGFAAIQLIVQQAKRYLQSPGYLFLEHGYTQGERVRALLQQAGYDNITTLSDLAGLPRVTWGKGSSVI